MPSIQKKTCVSKQLPSSREDRKSLSRENHTESKNRSSYFEPILISCILFHYHIKYCYILILFQLFNYQIIKLLFNLIFKRKTRDLFILFSKNLYHIHSTFHLNHNCKIKDHLCAPCARVFKGNFSALCEKELQQFHGFLMLPTE